MKDASRFQTILKEWDAFCCPLIEGTRAFDSGKSWQDFQSIAPNQLLEDYKDELELYLRLSFQPPAEGLPPDIFAETPPVLGKALRARVDDARKFLIDILAHLEGPEIQSEGDFAKKLHFSFRELLLPSSPKQGDYTWTEPV